MSLDRDNVLGFTLCERKSRRHPVIKITYVDYTDDPAIVTGKVSEATIRLHKIEKSKLETHKSSGKKTKWKLYSHVTGNTKQVLEGPSYQ